MLPKIPYKMEKNKSQSIPMRSINLGSAAEPGELSDSLGISTRKFPYLTTRRGDVKQDGLDGVQAMTVFGGELVTVREDGLCVGENKVDGIDPGEKHFAPINSKLVIYPDKKYIQKDGENWNISPLDADVYATSAEFSPNSITLTDTYRCIASGQGCHIIGNQFNVDPIEKIDSGRWTFFNDTPYSDSKEIIPLTALDMGYYDDGSTVPISRIHFINNRLEFIPAAISASFLCRENGITKGTKIYVKSSSGDTDLDNIYVVMSYLMNYIVIDGYCAQNDTYVSAFVENEIIKEKINDYLGEQEGKAINVGFEDLREKYWLEKSDNGFVLSGDNIKKFSPSRFHLLSFSTTGWDKRFTNPSILEKIQSASDILITSQDSTNFPITFKPGEVADTQIRAIENIVEAGTEINVIPGKTTDGIVKIWVASDSSTDSGQGLSGLKQGDTVTISGTDNNDISFTISDIKENTIYAQSDIFNNSSEADFQIIRDVPDLDLICEKDNRLYGVNNTEKTIYVSALGDPTNMYTYEGVSTDSFAVAVGGEGDFTACCKYGEAVLFFKEDKLYKLTGSSPLDFALYSYDVDGVEAGSEKSCVVINEVLYYKGRYGVYAYTGGIPVLISECFGERVFTNAVAGTDGRYYYLSADGEDGKPYLFTYDTRTQLWLIEQKVRCLDFARTREGLHYAGEDGYVYKVGAGDASGEWLARWAPIYEIIDGKRSYSRILLRVSLPRGSYIIVKIRCDGREWREAGKIIGRTENVVPIRIPINRCDKFELELSGKGECTILDIMREYYVGGANE